MNQDQFVILDKTNDLLDNIAQIVTKQDCKKLNILHNYDTVLNKLDWYYSVNIELVCRDILPVFDVIDLSKNVVLYKYDSSIIEPLSDYVYAYHAAELCADTADIEAMNQTYQNLCYDIAALPSVKLSNTRIDDIDLLMMLEENSKYIAEHFRHACVSAIEAAEIDYTIDKLQRMHSKHRNACRMHIDSH